MSSVGTIIAGHDERDLWECAGCGFTMDAVHEDTIGGYSCPSCAHAAWREWAGEQVRTGVELDDDDIDDDKRLRERVSAEIAGLRAERTALLAQCAGCSAVGERGVESVQSAHLGLCAISAAITMIMLAAVAASSDTEILHYLPDEDREDGERLPDEFDVDSLFRAIAQAAP